MEGSTEKVKVGEARKAIATGEAQAIDIREKDAWLDGHIPGSLHAAGDQFELRLDDLSTEQPVIVVGDDAEQSEEVAGTLSERGFEAQILEGGMKAWKDENYTLQPTQDPDLDPDDESEDQPPEDEADQPA